MFTDYDLFAERGKFRAIIVQDADADAPYDDGSTPILARTYRQGLAVCQMADTTSYEVSGRILDALYRWHDDTDLFERYLRMFHGTKSIKWESTDYVDYVTFDTADWREAMGMTEAASASMGDYLAWLAGDVWGYVIQQNVTWTRQDDASVERQTWEDVDSCWGYYSLESVREGTGEALDYFAPEQVKTS